MSTKFKGALGQPICVQLPGLMLPTHEREQAEKAVDAAVAAARSEKLALLFEHYSVQQGNFAVLAMAMAVDLIPGFQFVHEQKRRGRPVKWDELANGYLVVEIERARANNTHLSVKDAARALAKRDPWKSLVDGKNPGETLRQQYDAAKDSLWARACRDAFAYHEAMGTIPRWERPSRSLDRNCPLVWRAATIKL